MGQPKPSSPGLTLATEWDLMIQALIFLVRHFNMYISAVEMTPEMLVALIHSFIHTCVSFIHSCPHAFIHCTMAEPGQ